MKKMFKVKSLDIGMKKMFIIKNIWGCLFFGSLFSLVIGCGSDFLDETPPSLLSPVTFFSNETEAEAAVIGGYDDSFLGIGTYGGFRCQLYEVWVDDWYSNVPTEPIFTNEYTEFTGWSSTPRTPEFQWAYETWFINIAPLTNAIAGIEGMEDFARKAELIGEAKFLRAHYYFQLVRTFGRVPLISEPLLGEDALAIPRAPVEDVYNLIISDLEDAATSLPAEQPVTGRPTRWAARAELAKVYLTLRNWPEASAQAIDVINSSGKSLIQGDYRSIFLDSNSNNNESIFEFQHTSGQITNQIANWPSQFACFDRSDERLPGGPWGGAYVASQDLLDSFEPGDQRFLFSPMYTQQDGDVIYFHRNRNCDYTYDSNVGYDPNINDPNVVPYYSLKRVSELYLEGEQANNGSTYNFIYTRLAEMYLISAEALNESGSGDPLTYLNAIRNRAGLANYAGATDQASLREAIRTERRHEFYDESIRMHDLRRYANGNVEILRDFIANARPNDATNIDERHLLWPITQSIIDANPGLQGDNNPGY